MIRIGKLTDYAVLILSHMAKMNDLLLSAATIASALNLPIPTVSKILKILSIAALVTSVRGVEGGYRLARAPETISLADIIAAMEGELAVTECSESMSCCSLEAMCMLRDNWRTINKMVKSLLAKLTIVDMQQPLSLTTQGLIDGK